MALVSYCATCDAEPGGCEHKGHRYLDPIQYLEGPAGGSIVPPGDEHDRFYNPPAIAGGDPPKPAPAEARPVQQLVIQLESILYLDSTTETTLRAVYQLDPTKTTRLVDHVANKVKAGGLSNPEGFLVSRLKQLTP